MKVADFLRYLNMLTPHLPEDAEVNIELMIGRKLVVLPIEDIAIRNKTDTLVITG